MKKPSPSRRVPAELDILILPASSSSPAAIDCLGCGSALILHQPDPQLPDRQLGTCEVCKRWYLVDWPTGEVEGVLIRLPAAEVIRFLSREDPAEGISLMGPEGD